jgi:hypothetical protein
VTLRDLAAVGLAAVGLADAARGLLLLAQDGQQALADEDAAHDALDLRRRLALAQLNPTSGRPRGTG